MVQGQHSLPVPVGPGVLVEVVWMRQRQDVGDVAIRSLAQLIRQVHLYLCAGGAIIDALLNHLIVWACSRRLLQRRLPVLGVNQLQVGYRCDTHVFIICLLGLGQVLRIFINFSLQLDVILLQFIILRGQLVDLRLDRCWRLVTNLFVVSQARDDA